MRRIILSAVIAALAVVQACEQDTGTTQTSRTESIGTDLPDDGGALTNSLYWTNNGHIYRGRCQDTETFQFDRPNCSQELVSMSYDTFKSELDGGLSDTIRDLTAQAKKIQDAITLIEADLKDALAELARLEAQSGGLNAELERLRASIRRFEASLADYKSQLALIDAALQEAVDQEIAAMRPIVMARISEWQGRIVEVSAQIEKIIAQFGSLRTEIETVAARVSALTQRSQNLQVDLAEINQRLELAYGDFSVYEETLRRLNSGITFTAMSTNAILLKQRLFIRRFESIFARHT